MTTEDAKQQLLARRSALLRVQPSIMANGTVEQKRAVSAELSAIRGRLREIAEVEQRGRGTCLSVPKRELIGRLLAWKARLQDRVKNPKASPAERLFATQAAGDIDKILFDPAKLP
jgi:hypothetical protein